MRALFIVQVWHLRLDRDPAHQWLRQAIKQIFLEKEWVKIYGGIYNGGFTVYNQFVCGGYSVGIDSKKAPH
nr:hypothetical protein [Providencia sp. G1(2023)]